MHASGSGQEERKPRLHRDPAPHQPGSLAAGMDIDVMMPGRHDRGPPQPQQYRGPPPFDGRGPPPFDGRGPPPQHFDHRGGPQHFDHYRGDGAPPFRDFDRGGPPPPGWRPPPMEERPPPYGWQGPPPGGFGPPPGHFDGGGGSGREPPFPGDRERER